MENEKQKIKITEKKILIELDEKGFSINSKFTDEETWKLIRKMYFNYICTQKEIKK
jgi:hypothetical protein